MMFTGDDKSYSDVRPLVLFPRRHWINDTPDVYQCWSLHCSTTTRNWSSTRYCSTWQFFAGARSPARSHLYTINTVAHFLYWIRCWWQTFPNIFIGDGSPSVAIPDTEGIVIHTTVDPMTECSCRCSWVFLWCHLIPFPKGHQYDAPDTPDAHPQCTTTTSYWG